jgi:hypothetical protein
MGFTAAYSFENSRYPDYIGAFALSVSKGPSAEKWFDKPVLSRVEGLTTNGIGYADRPAITRSKH